MKQHTFDDAHTTDTSDSELELVNAVGPLNRVAWRLAFGCGSCESSCLKGGTSTLLRSPCVLLPIAVLSSISVLSLLELVLTARVLFFGRHPIWAPLPPRLHTFLPEHIPVLSSASFSTSPGHLLPARSSFPPAPPSPHPIARRAPAGCAQSFRPGVGTGCSGVASCSCCPLPPVLVRAPPTQGHQGPRQPRREPPPSLG